jgi:hypothetical protein
VQPGRANSMALDVEQTYNKLKSMEDFDEVTEWFLDLFAKASELISGLKSKRASSVQFVDQYFGNLRPDRL